MTRERIQTIINKLRGDSDIHIRSYHHGVLILHHGNCISYFVREQALWPFINRLKLSAHHKTSSSAFG